MITGTITNGQTVPLPDGYDESECTWVLIPRSFRDETMSGHHKNYYFVGRKAYINEGTSGTYLVIGVKK